MHEQFSGLKRFLDTVKNVTLLQRLFGWGRVKQALVDAAADLASTQAALVSMQAAASAAQTQALVLQEAKRSLEAQAVSLGNDLSVYRERTLNCEREIQALRDQNIQLKKDDGFRQQKYSEEIVSLQGIKQQLLEERTKEVEQRFDEERSRLVALKETWAAHQTDVQGRMKAICRKHTLNYVDKAPFRGDPDNTLLICDEHVVFDAKSPAGDDLKNFPLYIKAQAEAAKKYAKIEGVKKDVFLVVPANTLHCLKEFVFNLADYDVFVVSADALEPLVLSLCRIEDYEFAEQLSPEDRDNVCRIIGKFAHLSKRRIQVDSFFARQFIELAYKCENDLPGDIHQKVLDYERSEKLNPPQEKRAKAINLKELDVDQAKIEMEVTAKGISLPHASLSQTLNDLRLYE